MTREQLSKAREIDNIIDQLENRQKQLVGSVRDSFKGNAPFDCIRRTFSPQEYESIQNSVLELIDNAFIAKLRELEAQLAEI